MTDSESEINKELESKGLDPAESFIVRKKVMYVPSDDLRIVELFQFVASMIMLVGGVFLGILMNPNSTYVLPFTAAGILLIILGGILFYVGVHRQFDKWEKEKVPVSKVN